MSQSLLSLIVLVGVAAVASVMMFMGASEVTFMGLLFTAAGAACCFMAYKAKTRPDSLGTPEPVGIGTVMLYAILGIGMLVGGLYILIAKPFSNAVRSRPWHWSCPRTP